MIPNSDNTERCRQVSDSIDFTLASHHIMFSLQCEFQGHSADHSSPSPFFLSYLPKHSWFSHAESGGWYETLEQPRHPPNHTLLMVPQHSLTSDPSFTSVPIIIPVPSYSLENEYNYWAFTKTDIGLSRHWNYTFSSLGNYFSICYTLKINFINYRISILI